jgi:hypothetical protein
MDRSSIEDIDSSLDGSDYGTGEVTNWLDEKDSPIKGPKNERLLEIYPIQPYFQSDRAKHLYSNLLKVENLDFSNLSVEKQIDLIESIEIKR